jgi:UDP-N-acetylmuramoyl-tripeptide--D-alanyl-D-alanine ligase
MNTLSSLISLYAWRYAMVLVQAFAFGKYDIGAYVRWYSATARFVWPEKLHLRQIDEILLASLWLFEVAYIFFALFVMAAGIEDVVTGGVYFGLALLLATPLVLAVSLPFLYVLARCIAVVITPKALGKALLCSLLEMQVRRLREAHKFDIVAVVGSMGKTSTKLAIAHTLEVSGRRVQYQKGNYNDRLTVPLVLFGQPLPHLLNVVAWVKILIHNEWKIKQKFPYDVAVLELGTDGIGQIKQFAYLRPELAVVTAVAEEHMEFFKTLDAVAHEELAVAEYSHHVLINTDDVAAKYLKGISHSSYGSGGEYTVAPKKADITGQNIGITKKTKPVAEARIGLLGAPGYKTALAAAAVADIFGTEPGAIEEALGTLKSMAGRMQILEGIQDTILLDDTYNATPAAVLSALEVLQKAKAPQRIAILGTMNELGKTSERAHRQVAAALDAKKIDLLITIGQQAHDYIALPARKNGLEVRSFMNPQAAGEYVKEQLKSGAVVLFKGSQNGVFAEEAIKPLLKNPKDAEKLVRQSPYWTKTKKSQFKLT